MTGRKKKYKLLDAPFGPTISTFSNGSAICLIVMIQRVSGA